MRGDTASREGSGAPSRRRRAFELLEIATGEDQASRNCDVFLIGLIALNVTAATLESVTTIRAHFSDFFYRFELFSVAVFSVEYLLRIWSCVESQPPELRHPVFSRLRYVVGPMALIDLFAILPFYAAALIPIDLRFLRVLRVLRILKLSHYFSALEALLEVIRVERRAFGAAFFLLGLGMLFAASGIYLFEHQVQPVAFGSIPAAMWWAVAALTTVGYGDVTPVTVGGKIFGSTITVLGVGMVALPTGILASGFSSELRRRRRLYAAEVKRALEDGVIDESERQHLDHMKEELGLTEEDVDEIASERFRFPRATAALLAGSHKCAHCGEPIDFDSLLGGGP